MNKEESEIPTTDYSLSLAVSELFPTADGKVIPGDPSCFGMRVSSIIDLPKGCGLDVATERIDAVLAGMRSKMIELHMAHTEGRKPNFSK